MQHEQMFDNCRKWLLKLSGYKVSQAARHLLITTWNATWNESRWGLYSAMVVSSLGSAATGELTIRLQWIWCACVVQFSHTKKRRDDGTDDWDSLCPSISYSPVHHHVYDWTNVHLGWANTARRTVKYRAGVMLNNASMHC